MDTNKKKVRVLGIDPGFGRIGYGVAEISGNVSRAIAFGCLETDKRATLGGRLMEIQGLMAGLIKKYQPEIVAVEELFFAKNVKTAIAVAHGRGVILAAAAAARLPIVELKPAEVKLTVTGSGSANKEQVSHMVKHLFSLREAPQSDDAADALAVALAGGLVWKWKQRTKI